MPFRACIGQARVFVQVAAIRVIEMNIYIYIYVCVLVRSLVRLLALHPGGARKTNPSFLPYFRAFVLAALMPHFMAAMPHPSWRQCRICFSSNAAFHGGHAASILAAMPHLI